MAKRIQQTLYKPGSAYVTADADVMPEEQFAPFPYSTPFIMARLPLFSTIVPTTLVLTSFWLPVLWHQAILSTCRGGWSSDFRDRLLDWSPDALGCHEPGVTPGTRERCFKEGLDGARQCPGDKFKRRAGHAMKGRQHSATGTPAGDNGGARLRLNQPLGRSDGRRWKRG